MNRFRCQSGFTYLGAMFAIVLVGLAMMAAGQQWQTVVLREKEAELLFRGGEIRRAIYTYCRTARAGMMFCPKSLDDLVKDPGAAAVRRYLRKPYKDPITEDDWELIQSRDGRTILGVRSKSKDAPLKQGGFSTEFEGFEGKQKYSDWVFICRQLETFRLRGQPGTAMSTVSPVPEISSAQDC